MTATVDGTDLRDPSGHPVLPPAYGPGELVGVGGSASVYRATDRRTGAAVAVKVLHSTADPGTAARFAAEVRVLQGLRHPGLAQIVDAGVDHHHPYLVTRFVEGRTLQAALHDGPIDVGTVTAMGARLASTLAHVHARGIVHRDVKPANILLDRAGLPFLTDFGVSRIVAATQMTETGVVVGTPAYMAPEQVRGVRVGPAADVYALGLVLLEMLTGLREYPGGLVESAVARLHRRPLVPTSLPGRLRDLLTEMTEDEPDHRPAAADVAARLAADDAPARTTPVGALPEHMPPEHTPPEHPLPEHTLPVAALPVHTPPVRRAVAVLAMAVALAVVAIGVFRLPGASLDATAGTPAVLTAPGAAAPPVEVGAMVADPVPAGAGAGRPGAGPVADYARTVREDAAPPVTSSTRTTDADRGARDDRSGRSGVQERASTAPATGTTTRDADRDDSSNSDGATGNRGNGNGNGNGNGGNGNGNGNSGGDQDEQ